MCFIGFFFWGLNFLKYCYGRVWGQKFSFSSGSIFQNHFPVCLYVPGPVSCLFLSSGRTDLLLLLPRERQNSRRKHDSLYSSLVVTLLWLGSYAHTFLLLYSKQQATVLPGVPAAAHLILIFPLRLSVKAVQQTAWDPHWGRKTVKSEKWVLWNNSFGYY